MSITSLQSLRTSMGLTTTTAAQDDQLQQFVDAAIAVVKKYCKRDFLTTTYTEFHSGDGRPTLLLRQRPVLSITSVAVDPYGAGGQKAGRFAADTLLTSGDDYMLVMDGNGVSKSGILKRIGMPTFAGYVGGIVYPSGIRQGDLSGYGRGLVWPQGDGNIKVVHQTSFTVEADLTEAANQIAKQMKAYATTGMPMASENFIDYAYTLLIAPRSLLSEARSILANYVEKAM